MSTRSTIVHLSTDDRVLHLYDDTWEGPKDCVTLDLAGTALAGFAASYARDAGGHVSLVIPIAVWDELVDAVIARRAEIVRERAERLAREAACPGHVWHVAEFRKVLNPNARGMCTLCYACEPEPPPPEAP